MDLSTYEVIAQIGTSIVVFGVTMEGIEVFIKIIEKRRARLWIKNQSSEKFMFSFIWLVRLIRPKMLWVEGISIGIVVAGLAIEWLGASGAEGIKSIENAKLNLRAETLEHENLLLQKQLQPRTISEKQIKDFIFLTEHLNKVPIGVETVMETDEAMNYAIRIRDLFTKANFKIPDVDQASGNSYAGVHILANSVNVYPGDGEPNTWPEVDFLYNAPKSIYEYQFSFDSTNNFARPTLKGSQTNDANINIAAFCFCLRQIGFTNIFMGDIPTVAPGELIIRVLPKVQ